MQAEIIATGSELVLGEQVDTNSPHIARKLREVGLPLRYVTLVGDDEPAMTAAIRAALARSEVIIVGGGLGPTVDDVTRPAVAKAVGRELEFRPELLAQIEARFRAFRRTMTENNRRQAYIPAGALPIENPVGTAPAFAVEHEGRVIVCLPGVPREMMYLLDHAVIPYLRNKFPLDETIVIRLLHTIGEGESRIDALIDDLEQSANPTIGLSAKSGQVDVRLVARAAGLDEAQTLLAALEAKVRERIGRWIYGVDDETLEGVITSALAAQGRSLATVELNTGGTIGNRFTRRGIGEAAGDVFRGGLVLPGVGMLRKMLDMTGDESVEHLDVVVRAAQRVRQMHDAALGLAALALDAGSEPGIPLYIALVSDERTETLERRYGGHADLVAQWTASLALGLLWRFLKATDG